MEKNCQFLRGSLKWIYLHSQAYIYILGKSRGGAAGETGATGRHATVVLYLCFGKVGLDV